MQNLRNSARSTWDIYTPVHCTWNWCQHHHCYISYIMRKQETIHFTTFSTHNWKKVLLMFSDCLIGNFSQLVVTCHVRLCIVINPFLSLYHCKEHKPTFQIISNWWLKYKFFLISSKYSYSCKQKGQKTTLLFSCGIITTALLIITDFR